jgi:hypothetical protein
MIRRLAAAGVALTLAAALPAAAQGRSQQQKNKHTPPSRNQLAATPIAAPASSGTAPLAWIDDASLLGADSVSVSFSAARWSGGGLSEVDAPVVDAAIGLAPRLQFSMSVPHVVGSADGTGAAGGIGTSFFTAKVGLYDGGAGRAKFAAAPTLQVLGSGVVAALGPTESRVHWGLPVSAEIEQGPVRLYGGGGYFSPGIWFTGGALAGRATDHLFVSGGVSRAWRRVDAGLTPTGDRKEISVGAAYVVTPRISTFGSLGRTFATLPENGAGTSIAGGLSVAFAAAGR